MASNRDRIGEMIRLIEQGGGPPTEKLLKSQFGTNWRNHARLPKSLSVHSDMDAYAWLYSITNNWRDAFEAHLKPEMRDAASAALAGRNKWAHGSAEIEDNLTLRALLGAVDLLKGLGAKAQHAEAEKLASDQQKEMTRKIFEKEGKLAPKPDAASSDKPSTTLTLTSPKTSPKEPEQFDLLGGGQVGNLTPWRIACPPRDDVLEGRLHKDSFAANLAAADRAFRREETNDVAETYADPIAFFNATHITHGLELTLKNAAKRLNGDGGPSTIGLQTSFGGGKTHTLLSLLHMCQVEKFDDAENLALVGAAVAVTSFRHVKTAVFVGTDKGPDVPLAMIGRKPIRTLWGYLAYRLGGAEGLAMIQTAEDAGTSPGAEVLQKLFRHAGPSLILLDELVAYVRQLSGERYEAHLTFFQSLTEAAAQTPNCLIVGSLPESDIEAGGGEKGLDTLRRLEKLFGRTQSAWAPAQGAETYAVIRRRLFQDLDANGEKARRKTVEEFCRLYRKNRNDFPDITIEKDYEEKLIEAYPIHPMLFDKLSTEWGGLDKFQRTRGVLSLLARNIYASYRDKSDEPLILPSSLRFNDPEVKGALIEPLPGPVWGAIVDGEVDGDTSLSTRLDMSRPRFREGQIARRAARAVFVCTAPQGEAKGGLTGPELKLACVTPGEQISIFGEALHELAQQAGHLYESGGRYWFGPQATLNKMVENRARDIEADRVETEIVAILRNDEKSGRGRWSRIHTAPNPANEVEDSPVTRLVLLGPEAPFVQGGASPADHAAMDAVARRSGGQRRFRNALVFLAADQRALEEARKVVRRTLAWEDIAADKRLDLTGSQAEDARNRASEARRGALQAVRKSWNQLLSPSPTADDAAVLELDRSIVRGTGQTPAAEAAWQKATESDSVLEKLGRSSLIDRLRKLWPDDQPDLDLDKVRDWFFEFPYMERLRDDQVLADAVSAAVADISDDGLALAASKSEDGTYHSLTFQKTVEPRFNTGALLVRSAVARRQLDAKAQSGGDVPSNVPPDNKPPPGAGATGAKQGRPKQFVGVVELDALRGLGKAGQIFETIISELDRAPNAKFRLTLEIHAESADGFADDIEDVVSDNAKTLNFSVGKFQ